MDWIEAKIQVRSYEIYTATKRNDERANYFEAKKQVEEAWQHLTSLKSGGTITAEQWEVMRLGLSTEEYASAVALLDTAIGGSDFKRAAQLLNAMPLHETYLKLKGLSGPQLIQLQDAANEVLAGAQAQEIARRISVVQNRAGEAVPRQSSLQPTTPARRSTRRASVAVRSACGRAAKGR